jgi:spore coat protein U-like protein
MRTWLRWSGLIVLILMAPFAAAQLGCTVSAPTMNFGNYTGALSTPGATPLTVTCPLSLSYTVSLNAGVGAGATTITRKMTGPGAATLSYQMFQNSSRTINFGNTVGTDTVSGIGILSSQTINIYPQAAAGQIVAAGVYTDTITVSVAAFLQATVTTTFTVTATVPATCTISASPLSFGNYSGTLVNAASALTVTCTNLTTFNIGLSAGTAAGATVITRKMSNPAFATLNYTLYRDSARTQNWGNTVGTDTLLSQGTGAAQMLGVFGQIPGGQLANPAVYTDTIVATITY